MDASDLLPSKASFGDGLGARVVTMSDETVKFVNELLVRRLLFLEFSRIASLYGSGVLGVRWKSFDFFSYQCSGHGPFSTA